MSDFAEVQQAYLDHVISAQEVMRDMQDLVMLELEDFDLTVSRIQRTGGWNEAGV